MQVQRNSAIMFVFVEDKEGCWSNISTGGGAKGQRKALTCYDIIMMSEFEHKGYFS